MRVWGVTLIMASITGLAAQEFTVQAGPTGRVVAVVAGRARTVAVLAGERRIACDGPEFALSLGAEGRVVDSTAYRAEPTEPNSLRCVGGPGDPLVELRYEAVGAVVRKHLRLGNPTTAPLLVRWVETESLTVGEPITYTVDPGFPAYGDWGQPVFSEHCFWGGEFPASRSCAVGGRLQVREYVGLELAPGATWEAPATVVGAAPDGAVEATLYDYVATLSPHAPRVPRCFIYWNGFRVIKTPDRTGQGLRMIDRARELREQTGFAFDAWTYDAAFDMYRPDALFVPQDPEVWPRSREALAPLGTPLGFWTSFSCIFDVPTHAWGRAQGYGLQHDAAYCLAEPTYQQAISDRLAAIVGEFGMRAINFDGMYPGQGFGCNQPDHGHLVGEGAEVGVWGTYGVIVGKMRIFERLRELAPDICLDLFVCAEWASPWWLTVLDGVHTVPGDTVASALPSPWLRDALITVRDEQVWELCRRQGRKFPLYAMDLYGNQVRADHLIDGIEVRGEAMETRWEDELTMATAVRGAIGNHIVCGDLHTLADSPSGLAFLGELGVWLRANEAIYRHWALLGGEPAAGEVYGYAHGDGAGRALVGLRNPTPTDATFTIPLDQANLGRPGPYQLTRVYPYRETTPAVDDQPVVRVAGMSVNLFEVRSVDRSLGDLPAGRWDTADGRLSVAAPAPDEPVKAVLVVPDDSRPWARGEVVVPDGCTAELQLLVIPPASVTQLTATCRVDLAEVPAAIHFRDRGGAKDAWVLMPVPPGQHTVEIRLHVPPPVRLEGWLRCRRQVDFQPTDRPAPAGLPPLPAGEASADWRTVRCLPTSFALNAEPLPAGVIPLAALRDRCVASQTGWGRVGWDESCWADDPTLRIGDRTFERGLGVHAPGRFEFVLDGAPRRLLATVGVHPIPAARRLAGWPKGSVVFRVDGDGTTLWRSDRLTELDDAVEVDVDLRGVRLLALIAEDAGDGPFDDLATWGEARLEPTPN